MWFLTNSYDMFSFFFRGLHGGLHNAISKNALKESFNNTDLNKEEP